MEKWEKESILRLKKRTAVKDYYWRGHQGQQVEGVYFWSPRTWELCGLEMGALDSYCV